MSVSDGYIIGTTKVVDHGPDNIRWNLVIIGDGYQAGEMSTYHADVQNFLTRLRTTPPYTELFCGINVHRVDVASTESGADDPGCGGNPATTANTYFDASFCTNFGGAPLERLLGINSVLALTVATAQVPLRHQVLCIVNSSKYGGAGGAVATCSTHASAAEIAIHEIGHSAFGLADEYGGNGAATPAGEPPEPNVTRDTNRMTNKWGDLIAATTPMPSQCDASCGASSCTPPASPPPAGAVGTYEGGKYSDCNVYRPLPSCYMRDYGPFCPVCSRVIRQTLQPFLPAESINLTTPSISFTNVPAGMGGVGVTTHRAIVWEVVSCRELTFQITAGPTGGFGTPNGASITVTTDPILPAKMARLWLSYTSTMPGDSANGSVTVQCVETGQSWVININANTIARPRSAVSLVLDRSGSMNDDAGDGLTKVEKLREAANSFISIMLPNDGIGVVRFNQTAQPLMGIQVAGPASGGAGRVMATNHIMNSINPNGATSIGDGIVKGRDMLNTAQTAVPPPYDSTAIIVLTDGQWNQAPSLADVSGSINAQTFAIGLGLPSNISVPALTTICQGHDGYLLITGAINSSQSMRLSKYFLQILAGITNAQVAVDPSGVLDKNSEHRIPFCITEADYGMDVIILSPAPQYIDFQLEAPDGTRIKPSLVPPASNSQFVLTPHTSYYRCALPVLPANANGSHEGQWHAVLKAGRASDYKFTHVMATHHMMETQMAAVQTSQRGVLPYELIVHTYSSLTFKANLTQQSFEVGTVATLTAMLKEYDAPLLGQAKVWAEVQGPNGLKDLVSLAPDHTKQVYKANYDMSVSGVYSFRIRARGETRKGVPFEREGTYTGVAVPGGDNWSPNDPKPNDLHELLCCIRKNAIHSELFAKRLKEWGIDYHSLLKCLDKYCDPRTDRTETYEQLKGDASALSELTMKRLLELMTLVKKEALD